MKWFYSGAKNLDEEQRQPEDSLGGKRSSTVVPNGRINSMFNDFSSLTIQEGKPETKAFFIKNTFDKPVDGVLLYATYPDDSMIEFDIAAVEGNEMELLKSSSDDPYYEEFFDCRVVFSYTDMNIKDTFSQGEIVTIEGTDIPVPDGRLATFMNNALKAFESNSMYRAIKISETVLRLEYKLLGSFINAPIIATFNPGTITALPFDFGFDNSRLISMDLQPGASIGIYLKRKIIKKANKTFEDYKEAHQAFVDSNYGQTQNLVTKTVNFCLEYVN